MGMVVPSQRFLRHRTPRCLILFWHRSVAPAVQSWSAGITMADSVLLRRTPRSATCPQWPGARPERLLPLFRAHVAAPNPYAALPSAASDGHSRLAAETSRPPSCRACAGPACHPAVVRSRALQRLHSNLAYEFVLRLDDAESRGAHRHPPHVHRDSHNHVVARPEPATRASLAPPRNGDALSLSCRH